MVVWGLSRDKQARYTKREIRSKKKKGEKFREMEEITKNQHGVNPGALTPMNRRLG